MIDRLRRAGPAMADRAGSVTILTALLLPMMALATLGGISIQHVMSKRQELQDLAELACLRATKPTRMRILDDDKRSASGRTLFENTAAARGLAIRSFAITTEWLNTTVQASAEVPALETFALSATSYTVSVSAKCQGMPPYPAVGDVILSSNFKRPDGNALPMKYGTWGLYKATEFGWEGGTGPGVEIQDWTDPKTFAPLPPGTSNPYVVELDSDANSSMHRTVELHKGTYRFSFWYFARPSSYATLDPETNDVAVYLEGVRPAGPRVEKLKVGRLEPGLWSYQQFKITVGAYSLYRLTIAAEGASDSYGGNFNDLKLEYIGRPGENVS